VLFARPEAGKTALALSIGVSAAMRGHRVLYVINEDDVRDLAVRAMTNCLNCTADRIREDTDSAVRLRSRGVGNLILREASRALSRNWKGWYGNTSLESLSLTSCGTSDRQGR